MITCMHLEEVENKYTLDVQEPPSPSRLTRLNILFWFACIILFITGMGGGIKEKEKREGNVLFLLFYLFCFVILFILFCFFFYFVLFCFVLFCFVLFCFVLFCFVLFCFVLFCFVLFCFVLFCFV